ncbi:MAG: hypothetical protein JNK89_11400, partial [Saprospiraceae bacterium]|nr:hypothetical protein [Saprospiraceae bacterium]
MRKYPAKLLLFGEYLILTGSRALAVPVPMFYGQWQKAGPTDRLGMNLENFARSTALAQVFGFNGQKMLEDLEAGWFFQSNIPQGYGLGSSGALCAAVYDRYVAEKSTDWMLLKQVFAGMESFFHGQSSGIDPLTSYLNQPLWISNHQQILPGASHSDSAEAPLIFLIDSRTPRQTAPLVAWFMKQQEDAGFVQILETDWRQWHNHVLQSWELGDWEQFWLALRQVSEFQLRYLSPMIPESLRSVWERSLEGTAFFLKICGAGGGGFVLGFARSATALSDFFPEHELIYPFATHALV